MSDEIVIVEYDPAWPSEFTQLRDRVRAALGDVAIAIEHVGSTAVPGLPAKDLIDMVAVVPSKADTAEAIRRLEAIGYEARGNLGVEGREAFWWPDGEKRHHLTYRRRRALSYRRRSPSAIGFAPTPKSPASTPP